METLIARASGRYMSQCRARVAGFVHRHYSLRGSLQLHRHALGWDIIRTPLNILWSVLCLAVSLPGWIGATLGWPTLQQLAKRLPTGLNTNVDRKLHQLIRSELLQLPSTDAPIEVALWHTVLNDVELSELLQQRVESKPIAPQKLQATLEEYAATRAGTADFANTLLMALTSKLALGQALFGALSAGAMLASAIATHWAVSQFWLGETLGQLYYRLLPISPPIALTLGVTVLFVLLLAMTAIGMGIVSDPLQARLGLHQRRLHKVLDAIEVNLLNPHASGLRLHEKYAGRSFDLLDMLAAVRQSL